MTWKERQIRSQRFWGSLPSHASAAFFLGVFCLFASIGFMQAPATGSPRWFTVQNAAFSGGIAVAFAFLGTRLYYRALAVLALLVFIVWPMLLRWLNAPTASSAPGMAFGTLGAICCIVAGYSLMLYFISTQGRRYFRLQTEIDLAGKIHRALAPAIEQRAAGFEFSGVSQPSGVMGGDLLDWVAQGDQWLCYVADVAGHGVAAGVVMGVVKSAARTWLQNAPQAGGDGLLPGLNRVLTGLLPPESYVTFAALRSAPGGAVHYAAAGHPPLLHFHAAGGAVTRYGLENFPLGMFTAADFTAGEFNCAPGDVLALFTDGLTDVFDAQNREFGLAGLEAALAASGRLPLAQARERIMAAARSFAAQTDDQTLLLLRRLA